MFSLSLSQAEQNLAKIFAIESMPGSQDFYMELCNKSLRYMTDTLGIELAVSCS